MATYTLFVEEIETLLGRIPASSSSEPMPPDVDQILEEAAEVLEQLKIEVHSIITSELRQQITTKIRAFDKEITATRLRILQGNACEKPLNDDERHQINMTRLRAAHSQLLESELVADDTLSRLHEQEDTLRRTVSTIRDTNNELNTSTRLLNRMNKWWRG